MNHIPIRQLGEHLNSEVTSFYLVRSRETRTRKTGEPYIHVMLADATGEIEARVWDNLEAVPAFDRDDFIKVKASVQEYKGRVQLSILRARPARDSEINLQEFFRRSARDPEEMYAELQGIVAEVADEHVRTLLEAVIGDAEIAVRLKRAPAAKTLHHAYLGGLLEHILSLCGLARRVSAHYGALDLDLLIAACVLHDIGKLYELEYERTISYTVPGHLLGHIVLGVGIVRRKIESIPGFPPNLAVLVEHLLISHHGEYEYGSPRLPLFPEAVVFHYLDDLDSKVNHMAEQIETAAGDGEWTGKSFSLGRALLRRDKYCPKTGVGDADAAEPPAPGEVHAGPGPAAGTPDGAGQQALPWHDSDATEPAYAAAAASDAAGPAPVAVAPSPAEGGGDAE